MISAHNFIIGTMYLDIGGTFKTRCLTDPSLEINLRYTKKGWLTKEEYKVEGELSRIIKSGKKQTE